MKRYFYPAVLAITLSILSLVSHSAPNRSSIQRGVSAGGDPTPRCPFQSCPN
jgi:hypothetical protein